MEGMNQRLRKLLYEKIKLEQKEMIILFPEKLNKLPKEDQVMYTLLESVSFMDLYKKIHYKIITNTLTEEDLLILPRMDATLYFEDIHTGIFCDTLFSTMLLDASVDFYNATTLEKIAQIKSMGLEDKTFLKELVPSFEEDLQMYDKKVNIETYYQYMKEIETYYEKKGLAIMSETMIAQVVSFIKNLYCWDQQNTVDNILELALIDYSYSKYFLKKEEYPDVANGRRKAIKRVNLFEEGTEKQIIEYALLDEYYLFELIDTYFYGRDSHFKEATFQAEVEVGVCDENIKDNVKEKIKKIEERSGWLYE